MIKIGGFEMKIRRYFSILIFSIFLVSYAQQDISPGSEIGDAIFRTCVFDTPQWINLGHNAIYFCSEGFFEWDTQDDLINSSGTHSVIQATGAGVELGYWPFSFFLEEYTQWGNGYTAGGGLSTNTRKTIINIAKQQYGAPYPQLFNEWYYPKIMTPRNMAQGEEGCFRCDGLVEYCYEQVGIAFFSEEEKQDCWFDLPLNVWPTFYPKAMMERMAPEAPNPPELEVTSPEDGDLIEDDVSIEFTADDGPKGSGIDIIYIFIDNKLVHKDDDDSDGPKEIQYDWDCSNASEGTHYIKIDAYDRAGNLREKEIKVYKGEAPIVVYTAPSKGKTDVHIDIKTIVINFSREMDKVSTEGAVKIEPSLPYTTSWFDESTLDLSLNAMLDYCKEYTITISGTAMDTIGVHLDGNGDGRPGDPYIFTLTTESPPLSLHLAPATDLFELKNPGNCQSKTGNIIIDGSKLLKEVSCKLSKTISGSGLNFSGGEGSFTIPAGGSQNTDFTVTACNEGGISVNLEATFSGNVCGTTVGGYSASLEKEKDHPDDNQSPGLSSYPTSIILADETLSNPDEVGIFIYGWTIGYAHLLGKYGIPIIPIFSDFNYWKNPDTLLSDEVNLVVIGSGALSGFNSQEFKQNLEGYVVNGGNLLVFTHISHGATEDTEIFVILPKHQNLKLATDEYGFFAFADRLI